MSTTRSWLITGANRGLGAALAEAVLDRGDTALLTARDPVALDHFAARGARRFVLDVTHHDRIGEVVAAAAAVTGSIDVLVANAGFGLVGALEELTEGELREVLETDLFGALSTIRAVLPGMRAAGHGHIVAMSSVGGVVGNPGHAAYATAKFALEGACEALAGEVAPFGIRVTIVEPGRFRTGFAAARAATPLPAYADTAAGRLRAQFHAQHGRQPGDPRRAAQAVLAAVDDPSTPLRLPLGAQAVDRIRDALQRRLADLAEVEERARAADYPAGT